MSKQEQFELTQNNKMKNHLIKELQNMIDKSLEIQLNLLILQTREPQNNDYEVMETQLENVSTILENISYNMHKAKHFINN